MPCQRARATTGKFILRRAGIPRRKKVSKQAGSYEGLMRTFSHAVARDITSRLLHIWHKSLLCFSIYAKQRRNYLWHQIASEKE